MINVIGNIMKKIAANKNYRIIKKAGTLVEPDPEGSAARLWLAQHDILPDTWC